jgi:hypothetical protein
MDTEKEIEQLKNELMEVKRQMANKNITQFEDIKFYPLLKVGKLFVRTIDTSNQF